MTSSPTNVAIISFLSEYDKPLNIPDDIPHLYFVAEDLSENDLLDVDGYKKSLFKEAAIFISNYVALGYEIWFQCEKGVSRSAGCAAATEQFYVKNGIRFFEDYNLKPNKVFYNNLLHALKEVEENKKNTRIDEIVEDLYKHHKELMDSLAKGEKQ